MNLQTFLDGENVYLKWVSFQDAQIQRFDHSLADGRSPIDRQTQPTLPRFNNVSRDSSKAGNTKKKFEHK